MDNAEYFRRAAASARAAQRAASVLQSLRQQGQGQCLCGETRDLYTFPGAPAPRLRCIACWREYADARAAEV